MARSNENARLLLDVRARFNPESALRDGADTADDQIIDLKPQFDERFRAALEQARTTLQERLRNERDPAVRRDLQILIKAADDSVRGIEMQRKYHVRYFNLSRLIYSGARSLLDDNTPADRRRRALTRLKRYAGLEAGYEPITVLAEARTKESFQAGLLAPTRDQIERDLANSGVFFDRVGQLFRKYRIGGYREAYERLRGQIATYNAFVRSQVLPRARRDYRLSHEEYADRLQDVGVDIPPDQLAALAHAAFDDYQKQIRPIAAAVAKQRGLASSDYRDVIRSLKKDQFDGDEILGFYEQRLKEVDSIIRRERLVSLPDAPVRVRLAGLAESDDFPAPHTRQPRLVGNKGEEHAEFILPLHFPAPPEMNEPQRFDDFTYKAASWTVTAHEVRPGHELQFDTMVDKGTSIARALFAYNTTDVEGWGLYAEAILFPYMPPEGQLGSLRSRMLRAARAFLDPEVQSGKITPAQAKTFLVNELAMSESFAQMEVERYTFLAPGQTTAFFYGFLKMQELRAEAEKMLGPKFDQQRFHDFVLSQGLLPPEVLRTAVIEDFIRPQMSKAGDSGQ